MFGSHPSTCIEVLETQKTCFITFQTNVVPLVQNPGCRMHLDTTNLFQSKPNFLNYRRAGLLERSDSAGYKFLELVSTYTDGLGLQHMTGGSTNESQNAAAGCDQLQYGIAGSTANELAGNCSGQNSGARKASRKSTVCRLIRQHCPRTAGLPI